MKHISGNHQVGHLTISGENIISTYDHPYYVKDKGFVSAGALWIGAELIDKNGNVVLVKQLYRENLGDESVKVYNFQVEDYHTYFVGLNTILVHNSNCRLIQNSDGSYDADCLIRKDGHLNKEHRQMLNAKRCQMHTPLKPMSQERKWYKNITL